MHLNKIDFFFFLTLLICIEVHGIINGVANPDSMYTSLGCWKDTTKHAIPSLEQDHTHPILSHTSRFKRRKAAIMKCLELARSLGFSVFALQNGGECLGSSTAHITYRKYGTSPDCKKDGKGGRFANQVYQIKKEYVCNQQFARTNDAQDSTDLILGPTRLTKRKCKDKCLKMRNCNSIQLCCPENHKTCDQYECSLFKENSRKTKNNTVDIPGNCFVNSRNCDFITQINELVGHWKSAVSDKNWECFRHRLSDIELDCSGNRLTFIGSLVFWETTGDYGIYDGLDTIHWKSGKWIRRDYIFERLTGKHCDGSDYGQFFSLADAKEACRKDPKCGKIYDQGCNGSPYSLCPLNAKNKDSGRSCVYIKPKYVCASQATEKDDVMECQDGFTCKITTDPKGWRCCNKKEHGGRKKCPKNKPVICGNKICDGGSDFCCAFKQSDCNGIYGGVFPC